jgi:hypothetical protein
MKAQNNKKGKIKELSATGTGASVTPGEGEGVATKYAFTGPGGVGVKRKKSIVKKDKIKVFKSESYNNEIKKDAISIFSESVRWWIKNK